MSNLGSGRWGVDPPALEPEEDPRCVECRERVQQIGDLCDDCWVEEQRAAEPVGWDEGEGDGGIDYWERGEGEKQ